VNWKLNLGNFLFKHRSFTPLPVILTVFVLFKPSNLEGYNIYINIGGLMLSMLGEFIRIMAVGFSFEGTSGRESYLRAENLNTTGIYSVVRNPLYIGNYFMFAGLVAVFANYYALIIVSVFLIGQYYFVILAEENYLKNEYAESFAEYCRKVKRVVPVFNGYRKNRNPFNLKKVIFKENDSVFNMLLMFILVLVYKERVFYGTIQHATAFIGAGAVLLISYIIVKIIKKRNV